MERGAAVLFMFGDSRASCRSARALVASILDRTPRSLVDSSRSSRCSTSRSPMEVRVILMHLAQERPSSTTRDELDGSSRRRRVRDDALEDIDHVAARQPLRRRPDDDPVDYPRPTLLARKGKSTTARTPSAQRMQRQRDAAIPAYSTVRVRAGSTGSKSATRSSRSSSSSSARNARSSTPSQKYRPRGARTGSARRRTRCAVGRVRLGRAAIMLRTTTRAGFEFPHRHEPAGDS